jgi:PKD repeat protein
VISTSNLGPEAKFRAPSSVNVGESVIFIDESSDPERGALSYVWDFGDGATSTLKNPIHQYQTPDSVIVTLTVTDDMEVSSTTTRTIIIFPAIRPEADFSILIEVGTINDIFEFYDESSDADGSILSWEWDFGDGDTSSRMNPTHNFNDKGTYRVTLTVIDNDGNMDSVTKSITITNLPPNATFSASMTTAKANEEIKFTDDSIDPEGHRLIYSYDFGDGSTSDASNPTHSYEEEGSYTVTLTVTDDEGDSDSYSLNVEIEKDTPETNGGIPGFPVTSVVIGLIIGVLLLSNIPRYYRREII